jgi:hypothetical protein
VITVESLHLACVAAAALGVLLLFAAARLRPERR